MSSAMRSMARHSLGVVTGGGHRHRQEQQPDAAFSQSRAPSAKRDKRPLVVPDMHRCGQDRPVEPPGVEVIGLPPAPAIRNRVAPVGQQVGHVPRDLARLPLGRGISDKQFHLVPVPGDGGAVLSAGGRARLDAGQTALSFHRARPVAQTARPTGDAMNPSPDVIDVNNDFLSRRRARRCRGDLIVPGNQRADGRVPPP